MLLCRLVGMLQYLKKIQRYQLKKDLLRVSVNILDRKKYFDIKYNQIQAGFKCPGILGATKYVKKRYLRVNWRKRD